MKNKNNSQTDRRTFVKQTAAGATGLLAAQSFAPGSVLGANERIRIASIGCGGRGGYLWTVAQGLAEPQNVTVVGVCDVWKKNLDKNAALIKEKTGKQPFTTQRYRDILQNEDVDAVIIATPDFAHSPILAEAARTGKHAYCEKPMATNMKDANAAVDAVKESGITCQVGTQRRSHPVQQNGKKIVESGILGKISEIECFYNRNTPSWARDYSDVREEDVDWAQYQMNLPKRRFDPRRYRCWHLFKDFTNGLPGLLGSHVIDMVPWYMEDPLPTLGVALGANLVWDDGRGVPDTTECLYLYPKGFMVRMVSRLGHADRANDIIFRGTNGLFDTRDMTAYGTGGAGPDKIEEPVRTEGYEEANSWPGAMNEHMGNWLSCIRSGATPNASVDAGYSHSVASIMAFESMKSGRRLSYDFTRRRLV